MSRAWPDMLRRYLDAPHESKRPYCENEGEAIPDGKSDPWQSLRAAALALRSQQDRATPSGWKGQARPKQKKSCLGAAGA